MIKKVFTISMVIIMFAGIFFSVANFIAPDLEAAETGGSNPLPFGAWTPFIEGVSYCLEHPLQECVVGDVMWGEPTR
jgi:hypothetical protein